MPVKIARSAPRPSFGLPELLVVHPTSRQSCCKAGKARIFTPVRESSGESRVNATEQFDAVDRSINVILQSIGGLDRSRLKALEWSLNEITDNVLNHAE